MDPRSFPRTRMGYRIRYYLEEMRKWPLRRTSTALLSGFAAYIVAYNVGVYCVYGPDHPRTRFMWRIRKARGELTEEQLQKEGVVKKYFETRILDGPERSSANTDPHVKSFADLR